jgi:hypothetical protein
MRLLLFVSMIGVIIVIGSVGTARAQFDCGPDSIVAESSADTIFVQHLQAERNCCTDLTLRFEVSDHIVDFYEGDAGDWCYCTCCFKLAYDVDGFQANRYLIRVWNEDGSEFYGQTEVEVPGGGGLPELVRLERGDCLTPAESPDEPPGVPVTWGVVRARYR